MATARMIDRATRMGEDATGWTRLDAVPSLAAMATASIPVGTGIGALNAQAAVNQRAIVASLSDPLVTNQWHLGFLGDLATVWQDYTGKDVSFGVYDSGVDTRLSAFKGYDASKEIRIDGKLYRGDYRPAAGEHGTAVAGLIGARADGIDTVGISYDAKLTSVNIFDPYSGGKTDPGIFINAPDSNKFFKAIAASNRFDVTNNSWGVSAFSHDLGQNRLYKGSFGYNLVSAITFASDTGRGGLGTIALKAAGNSGVNFGNYLLSPVDVAADSSSTDRHWTLVGAFREVDGNASSYSNRGAGLFISAPSNDYDAVGGTGIWTTDVKGREGYNTTDDPGGALDYTDSFGGTSAATPIASGVVGLMLDANPNLGWRDVKNIIAASAKMPVAFNTKPTTLDAAGSVYNLNEGVFQITGRKGANTVNGGGYHFSTDYGYGAIDGYGATRMAEVWNLFGDAKTSANEAHVVASQAFNTTLADARYSNGKTTVGKAGVFTINVADNIDIEHVDLTLAYTSKNSFSALTNNFSITLTSPDGTEYVMSTESQGTSFGEPGTIGKEIFGLAGYRGELTKGTWKVAIADLDEGQQSIIKGINLDFYGSAITNNNVYHFTDEMKTMTDIAGEKARTVIADSNGGTDWLDFAAVSKSASVDMNGGGQIRIGATNVARIAATAKIENIVMGDGGDTVLGNALDNQILGMRGSDDLNGGAGNDFLIGGAGFDTLTGGSGQDVFYFDTTQTVDTDHITDMSKDDLVALTKRYDTNGVIKLSNLNGDGVLRFDAAQFGQRVIFDGVGAASLYLVGQRNGVYYYSTSKDTKITNAIALGNGPLDATSTNAVDTHLTPSVSATGFEPAKFDAPTSTTAFDAVVGTGFDAVVDTTSASVAAHDTGSAARAWEHASAMSGMLLL